MVCSRIDCAKSGSAGNPQHQLPAKIDERIAWMRKLRDGDANLEAYLATHASKPQTSLKCCRSHFRRHDVNLPGPTRNHATSKKKALPMSPIEERAYRKQLERDESLEQIREQATLGTSIKVLRGGRHVVHQRSARQELQPTSAADRLQAASSSATAEPDALGAALANSMTQEARAASPEEVHTQHNGSALSNSGAEHSHRDEATLEEEHSHRVNAGADIYTAEHLATTEAADRELGALASDEMMRASYESKLQSAQKEAADSKHTVGRRATG